MQHDGAKGSAAHAPIRDAHHVLDASAGQFLRNGHITRFGHTRRTLGANVFQHQDVIGMHIQIVAVDAQGQVFAVFKHHGTAFVLHQNRVGGRLFDDGPARGQVALQHGDAALGVNGLIHGAHHVLYMRRASGFNVFAQSAAIHRERIQLEQGLEFME